MDHGGVASLRPVRRRGPGFQAELVDDDAGHGCVVLGLERPAHTGAAMVEDEGVEVGPRTSGALRGAWGTVNDAVLDRPQAVVLLDCPQLDAAPAPHRPSLGRGEP